MGPEADGSGQSERELDARIHRIFLQMRDPRRMVRDEEAYDIYSKHGRVFMLVFYFDGEVFNGGIHQWILNPTGMYVAETKDALIEIGASEAAAVVGAALALFPAGCPARSYAERTKQIDALSTDAVDRLTALSDHLSENRREVLLKLLAYCGRHPDVTQVRS